MTWAKQTKRERGHGELVRGGVQGWPNFTSKGLTDKKREAASVEARFHKSSTAQVERRLQIREAGAAKGAGGERIEKAGIGEGGILMNRRE